MSQQPGRGHPTLAWQGGVQSDPEASHPPCFCACSVRPGPRGLRVYSVETERQALCPRLDRLAWCWRPATVGFLICGSPLSIVPGDPQGRQRRGPEDGLGGVGGGSGLVDAESLRLSCGGRGRGGREGEWPRGTRPLEGLAVMLVPGLRYQGHGQPGPPLTFCRALGKPGTQRPHPEDGPPGLWGERPATVPDSPQRRVHSPSVGTVCAQRGWSRARRRLMLLRPSPPCGREAAFVLVVGTVTGAVAVAATLSC